MTTENSEQLQFEQLQIDIKNHNKNPNRFHTVWLVVRLDDSFLLIAKGLRSRKEYRFIKSDIHQAINWLNEVA